MTLFVCVVYCTKKQFHSIGTTKTNKIQHAAIEQFTPRTSNITTRKALIFDANKLEPKTNNFQFFSFHGIASLMSVFHGKYHMGNLTVHKVKNGHNKNATLIEKKKNKMSHTGVFDCR